MKLGTLGRVVAGIALAVANVAPAQAQATFEAQFDSALGTQIRAPRDFAPDYSNPLVAQIAQIANSANGRIGVAAIDLSTGQEVAVLGDQPFPMASTSKIAIAATYLEGVDQGRWTLTSEFPLMIPVASRPFSSAIAPVRAGEHMTARELIELMITRSSNPATDALLRAVGGPSAVNDWARRAGIQNFNLSRDIAKLLAGVYQGKWLSASSRQVIIGAMERCRTGTGRIPALMPGGARVAHKTGTLSNTSSDIGIITGPDGRSIAVAIYVTGQGGKANRDSKIATLARVLYDGYGESARQWADARYRQTGSSVAAN
jgi:beta-lactamase class A